MAKSRMSPAMKKERAKRQKGVDTTRTKVNRTSHESLRRGYTPMKGS